ncbi:MAG: hypothetical protein D6805_09980 [Planctomycetota bacterium]|nr:MAG: hypothetical protein D6805_09980 [Planctomycetota bacterium]
MKPIAQFLFLPLTLLFSSPALANYELRTTYRWKVGDTVKVSILVEETTIRKMATKDTLLLNQKVVRKYKMVFVDRVLATENGRVQKFLRTFSVCQLDLGDGSGYGKAHAQNRTIWAKRNRSGTFEFYWREGFPVGGPTLMVIQGGGVDYDYLPDYSLAVDKPVPANIKLPLNLPKICRFLHQAQGWPLEIFDLSKSRSLLFLTGLKPIGDDVAAKIDTAFHLALRGKGFPGFEASTIDKSYFQLKETTALLLKRSRPDFEYIAESIRYIQGIQPTRNAPVYHLEQVKRTFRKNCAYLGTTPLDQMPEASPRPPGAEKTKLCYRCGKWLTPSAYLQGMTCPHCSGSGRERNGTVCRWCGGNGCAHLSR